MSVHRYHRCTHAAAAASFKNAGQAVTAVATLSKSAGACICRIKHQKSRSGESGFDGVPDHVVSRGRKSDALTGLMADE